MFSLKESLRISWDKFKINLGISILSTLIMLILGSISWKEESFHLSSILFAIAVIAIMLIVKIGYTKIFLRINDGESPKLAEIFQEYKTFWRFLGISILMPLAVLGGLILLIIPGIFWAVRFSFSQLIVVDTKMGPIAAMKESYAITKGSFWKLLGFYAVMGFLNLSGLLLFGIGLLMTIPLTTLASIYIYRELSKAKAGLIAPTNTTSPQVA
jgi:uncharacterized membrane protein